MPDPGSDGGAEATSKATPARARPSKDERVAAIRDLMARLEWKPGQTGPELARLWRVSPHTVVRDAAEAWRQLRDTGDVEAAKADFASRTEQWAEEARQSGDYIAASRLFELHGRATGALGSTSTPSFSQILAAEVETGHGPIKVSAALELLEVLIELALQSKDQAQRDGVRVAIRRVHGLPIDIEVEPT